LTKTEEEEMSLLKRLLGLGLVSGALATAFVLLTPRPADAFIHEIIAAMCRAGGEEVIPPGQVREGEQSFLRALQATGFIESMVLTDTALTINFNPDVPASKFKSAGVDLILAGQGPDGRDLILSPLVIPDPEFPAHAACHNLR
jgi:hypothetical protein